MNIIVLAIKPMQPDEPKFPVRVEFNWGASDELVGNSVITVEAWLNKDDVSAASLSEVHGIAVREALKLLERAPGLGPFGARRYGLLNRAFCRIHSRLSPWPAVAARGVNASPTQAGKTSTCCKVCLRTVPQ